VDTGVDADVDTGVDTGVPARISLSVQFNTTLLSMDQVPSEISIKRLKFKTYLFNFQGPLHV